jgi:hypothetical protein
MIDAGNSPLALICGVRRQTVISISSSFAAVSQCRGEDKQRVQGSLHQTLN